MKRRYREKKPGLSVASFRPGRIHDFLKGYGTLCKDGSILWDWWRPPTKRQVERAIRNSKKFTESLKAGKHTILPSLVNAVMPQIIAADIVSVQPMNASVQNYFKTNEN